MAPEDDPVDDITAEEYYRGMCEAQDAAQQEPRHTCDHDGCEQDGDPCFLPDDPEGKPSHHYCDAHAHENGFCSLCGGFFGGIESFEFGNGLCEICDDAVRSDAGEFDDEDSGDLEFEDI